MSWKIAFVLSAPAAALATLALLAGGCSNDACDLADQQLEACATQNVTTPSTALECTAKRVCQSGCIQGAACTTLQAAFCMGQTVCPPESSADVMMFKDCMATCEGM
jgi:hypothetical protein